MQQVTINNGTLSLTALNYGAIIQKLEFTDRNGRKSNVVVGLDKPADYLEDTMSLGACIGRFAGRISGGGFTLSNRRFNIYQENGVHLHGGQEGFAKKYWQIKEVDEGRDPRIVFNYISEDLEEGYPGKLDVDVSYQLQNNALKITHEAVSNKPTIVNLTNHSYFRLDDQVSIDEYHLKLHCPFFLETDEKLLPTGNKMTVLNTELDFLEGKRIGNVRMDTPFVRNENTSLISEVYSIKSGICMRVSSNQPGVVVYTPQGFPAICFETQNYPDSPNFEHFPSSILMPGERYINTAVFEFDLVN